MKKKYKLGKSTSLNHMINLTNLHKIYLKERKRNPAKGADGQTSKIFGFHLDKNLKNLYYTMINGQYQPGKVKIFYLKKSRKKHYILCFRDRIVQRALSESLTKQWEPLFHDCSYAFRPGRSYQDAQKRVLQYCQVYKYITILDIKDFFESISHNHLTGKLHKLIDCKKTTSLLTQIIKTGMKNKKGLLRGAILSPLLSNYYLNDFDWAINKRYRMVRYCDDMALFSRTRGEMQSQIDMIKKMLRKEKLRINHGKIQVASYRKGFKFLGTYFRKG